MSQNNKIKNASKSAEAESWRELAEKASHEMNPKKLVALVKKLCDELDKESAAKKGGNGKL